MTSPFRQLHHICLVVHDIDAAIAYYEGIGIGPWQDYPPLSQFTDLNVPNPQAFSQLKYRYADLDNVQVQLCEPPKLDCPQRRFLDTHGEGVFHIGFESGLDTAISQAQESGLDVIMSGRRENGTGFAYFDTLDKAGVVWMCRADQASAVMNVLIVHAHPEPKSFNGALTRTAVKALREQGHTVEVSNLYAMKWKPAADADDYAGPREDEDYLRIDREQTFAHEAGTTACDIVTERAKVRCADFVLFQYPIWWFGPPAILKGWFDRVFTRGFAYLPGRKYDNGQMAGKLAMVSVTTGTSADTYAPDGIDGAILDILWPVHNGVLRYTGFDVLEPFITHMPGKISYDERRAVLDQYASEIRDLASRQRLFFHPRDDYGPDERLLPGVRPQSGFQHRTCG